MYGEAQISNMNTLKTFNSLQFPFASLYCATELLDFASSLPPVINQLDAAKLDAEPYTQLLFAAAKKLADKLAKMTNNLDEFGDQMLKLTEK